MDTLQCGRCNAARDTRDNFCRACGHQFTVNLPAVRESRLPATRPSRGGIPTPLVGSMALLAVGTGLEWLARRMAGSAARAAGRALIGAERPRRRPRVPPPPAAWSSTRSSTSARSKSGARAPAAFVSLRSRDLPVSAVVCNESLDAAHQQGLPGHLPRQKFLLPETKRALTA